MLAPLPRSHRSRRGFTLVELLVVISIIAILAAIGYASYGGVRVSALDTERRSMLGELTDTFDLYQTVNGRLPNCTGGIVIEKVGADVDMTTLGSCADASAIESFFANNVTVDIVDPRGAGDATYRYVYRSGVTCGAPVGGTHAILYAELEESGKGNAAAVCPGLGTNPFIVRF